MMQKSSTAAHPEPSSFSAGPSSQSSARADSRRALGSICRRLPHTQPENLCCLGARCLSWLCYSHLKLLSPAFRPADWLKKPSLAFLGHTSTRSLETSWNQFGFCLRRQVKCQHTWRSSLQPGPGWSLGTFRNCQQSSPYLIPLIK